MNEYAAMVLIGLGIIFNLSACLGLVRLPDVYTRLQSSTKAVTLGTCLILAGIGVYSGSGPTLARAFLVFLFVIVSAPTAAHAIARGAHSAGIRVERVTAEGLIGRTIESELWDIIRQGTQAEKDRFDRMLEICPVYDWEERLTGPELFHRIARPLGELLRTEPGRVEAQLREREKEATTALAPEVALPHILVEGEGIFALLAARVRGGVRFSEAAPRVRAVFALAGSRDQWHFHLRSLAAIAAIVQTEGFYAAWDGADGPEDLRNLLRRRARRRRGGESPAGERN